jgi:hypothetical protein
MGRKESEDKNGQEGKRRAMRTAADTPGVCTSLAPVRTC